jgi:uncharacterized protein (DUF1697 family)
MADLRDSFTAQGYYGVRTYIQSGNVLFEASEDSPTLETDIEGMIARRFGVDLVVVVLSHEQMRDVVRHAPGGFGADPEKFHSDVVFLKAPLTASQAMGVVALREGVDQVWAGQGVLYFARLSARRTQSKMSRIGGTPEYQLMTIRNWNTTIKLLDLLDRSTT